VSPIGNIPPAPPFRLDNHQLVQVLCQVRFSPVLRIQQDDAVIAFQEAIRGNYPRYAKQQALNVVITPNGVQQQQAPTALHRFDDSDGVFKVSLTPEFIALEASRYAEFDDFVGRAVWLTEAVQEHFAPAEIHRVGLRFINELRLTDPDARREMRQAITQPLLGALGSDELGQVVAQAQQILELRGEEYQMLVRHGFNPEGGTTVLDPAAPPVPRPEHFSPFYLLDIDAYSERNMRYSVEGIETTLREFNENVRSLFAWSVREDYRRDRLGQTEA
jgi:uncharacterized protein (TIGR04255 family)